MNQKTKVIFRRSRNDGEIIAVLPELAGDSNPYKTCLCYVHVGQHSAISTDYTAWTVPVSLGTYAPLLAELESLGYDLKVCKRSTRGDLEKRKKQCGYYGVED